MKLNTLEKVARALESGGPEIHVPAEIAEKARAALELMLKWS